MDVVGRVKEVLGAEPNDAQLDKFLSDLRESLSSSNKQFLSLSVLVITGLAAYHLVTYEGAAGFSVSSIQVTNTALFRRVFLVVPAAFLAAMTCIGYLRRCQREVYDYLAISRYRILGKTGLHELRLPSDYLLGMSVLHNEGGALGRIVSSAVSFLCMIVFTVTPAIYIAYAALENIGVFTAADLLALAASCIAILLVVGTLIVVGLALRIKAT